MTVHEFRDNYRNIPDPPEPRGWNAAEWQDLRTCNEAKLALQLCASVLMKLPRCQNASLPNVADIVTDMRELIGRLECAEELINAAIENEDEP